MARPAQLQADRDNPRKHAHAAERRIDSDCVDDVTGHEELEAQQYRATEMLPVLSIRLVERPRYPPRHKSNGCGGRTGKNERDSDEFYANPDFKRVTARPCTLISSYAFVDPRGRLYPCLTLDMGNVFERPFEEVWNGRKFRAFRKLLRREQRLPLCERCPA